MIEVRTQLQRNSPRRTPQFVSSRLRSYTTISTDDVLQLNEGKCSDSRDVERSLNRSDLKILSSPELEEEPAACDRHHLRHMDTFDSAT
jgi:hypothetical protein